LNPRFLAAAMLTGSARWLEVTIGSLC